MSTAETIRNAENGALRVLPGRWREPLEHVPLAAGEQVFDEAIRPDLIDGIQATTLAMPAGCYGLFDGLLPHASSANRSSTRRCAFMARYIPTSVHFDRGRRARYGPDYPGPDYPLYWVSGEPGDHVYVNRPA